MMKTKYFLVCVAFLFSCGLLSSAWADCPKPATIHYQQSGHLSNWFAPFYEGFTIGQTHHDRRAVAFLKAEWGRANGDNTGEGSTLCFYRGDQGGLIMMGQNTWGHVVKPKGLQWHKTYDNSGGARDAMKLVWACQQQCHFHFGLQA